MAAELGLSDQDGYYGFLCPINTSVFTVSTLFSKLRLKLC